MDKNSKLDYHETYIPGLKKTLLFCNKCGEYGTLDFTDGIEMFYCSNPMCPEQLPPICGQPGEGQ